MKHSGKMCVYVVCVCVCMCVRAYVYIYVCARACVHGCVHGCVTLKAAGLSTQICYLCYHEQNFKTYYIMYFQHFFKVLDDKLDDIKLT